MLSLWLRSTSDKVPTLRARSICSACCGLTCRVTALTTRGLFSLVDTSCATASTRMRSMTILETGWFWLSGVLTITSTKLPGSAKPATPMISLTFTVTAR